VTPWRGPQPCAGAGMLIVSWDVLVAAAQWLRSVEQRTPARLGTGRGDRPPSPSAGLPRDTPAPDRKRYAERAVTEPRARQARGSISYFVTLMASCLEQPHGVVDE
jgi:hypothetical protein